MFFFEDLWPIFIFTEYFFKKHLSNHRWFSSKTSNISFFKNQPTWYFRNLTLKGYFLKIFFLGQINVYFKEYIFMDKLKYIFNEEYIFFKFSREYASFFPRTPGVEFLNNYLGSKARRCQVLKEFFSKLLQGTKALTI